MARLAAGYVRYVRIRPCTCAAFIPWALTMQGLVSGEFIPLVSFPNRNLDRRSLSRKIADGGESA